MGTKSEQLQIRVSPKEKATLRRLARRAGMDLSSYVLSQALPSPANLRFAGLLKDLRRGDNRRYVFAELNELLAGLASVQLREAAADGNLHGLSPFEQNYVAAMVEHACVSKLVAPPGWVTKVDPLDEPWFATPFTSLRLHLLQTSPVAYRKRNLFVDSTVGDRV